MKKPIPPYFEYAPHSAKAEDKRIRDFRETHDPNDSALTNWNLFVFVTTLITGGILATALVYLSHAYRRNIFAFFRAIGAFFKMLDEIPTGYQTVISFGLLLVVFVSYKIVWRGRKDRKNGII